MILRQKKLRPNFILVISLSFLLFQFNLRAQESLLNSFDGYDNDWVITTKDDKKLKVKNQVLVKKRAEGGNSNMVDGTNFFVSYGYESIHLEFYSTDRIETVQEKIKRRPEYYSLELFKFNGNKLGHFYPRQIQKFDVEREGKPNHFIYSIDLNGIPLLMLNETSKIKIVRMDKKRS